MYSTLRVHKIGIVTDIEKAVLHVQLAEDDRNYTHFVWLSQSNDPESEFIIYRFIVWVSELAFYA